MHIFYVTLLTLMSYDGTLTIYWIAVQISHATGQLYRSAMQRDSCTDQPCNGTAVQISHATGQLYRSAMQRDSCTDQPCNGTAVQISHAKKTLLIKFCLCLLAKFMGKLILGPHCYQDRGIDPPCSLCIHICAYTQHTHTHTHSPNGS